jgi:hypothetical protein
MKNIWMLEVKETTLEASEFILTNFLPIQNGLGSSGLLDVTKPAGGLGYAT